ncbi:hypothetical protein TKK_0008212 [Trichogramma kaykai]
MSSARKVTCYTQIDKRNYELRWVISDYTLVFRRTNKLISPVFNDDKDDEEQFALELEKYTLKNAYTGIYNGTRLRILCAKVINTILLEYKLSVIKDDRIVHSMKDFRMICKNDPLLILDIPTNDLEKFISSTDTIIFRCELSVPEELPNHLLNHESAKINEVPKLKFDPMFLSEDMSDVKLRTTCGKEIPAHKVVLAAASPVFDAMFRHDMLEKKSQSVKMTDISYETAVEVLRYIYTGSVENQELFQAMNLLAAADKYQLETLKSMCEQIIGSNLSTENVVDILRVADKYNLKWLEKKAVSFIKWNISASSDSDDMKNTILGMGKFFSK